MIGTGRDEDLIVDWQAVAATLEFGLAVLDRNARIVACNPSLERILGRQCEALTGHRTWEIGLEAVTEDGRPLAPDEHPSAVVLRTGLAQRDVLVGIVTPDGERRWLRETAVPCGDAAPAGGVIVSVLDVTAGHERELGLRRLAEHDDLTGLPNRRRFIETLDAHLASRRKEDARGALVLLDLDRFKELNDTFGHGAGDRALVQAALALRQRLREDDVLARLGGDEFALLLRRATAADAPAVAESLIECLRGVLVPAPHGGSRPLGASVGVVALAGPATGTAERALERADVTMYEAKAAGGDDWRIGRRDVRRSPPGVGEQLEKRSRQLALANALGARLAGMTDATEIAEATVEELRRAFGYHLTAVIRLRDDDLVEAAAVRGAHFDALRLRGWTQHRDDGMIGRCLRDRTPVLVNDVVAEPGYEATPETADVRAELAVPLWVEGEIWGALNIEELEPGAFDHDDVILLSTLANQVGAALRAAALLERLQAVSERRIG